MRYRALALLLLLAAPLASAQFPPQIKNVVVIFQENRTPDNLFHFLTPACPLPPFADRLHSCTPVLVTPSCYDISPCGLSNQSGITVPVALTPVPLAGGIDPDHSHKAFKQMCDPDPVTMACRNDGAWKTSAPKGYSYGYVDNKAVTNSDGSPGHLLDPYLTFAKQYGWANFMFQTNQGPSYPAHQFMFAGTSAPTAEDDANSTFVSENFNNVVYSEVAGCLAPLDTTNELLSPVVNGQQSSECHLYAGGSVQECPIGNTDLLFPSNPVGTFCYSHQSMADVLDPHSISWKYYAPSPGSIWTAPDSIKSICQPQFVNPSDPKSALECTGKEWNAHVDVRNLGTDILRDIASCSLARVSWVIPDGRWSDHAALEDAYGPSWVAAVINAIGNNPKCGPGTANPGETFWQDTAIVVTWDDWGGWSDNQAPPFASNLPCNSSDCQGDYQYGFRVPLIVVSAYTPAGYIDNSPYDFGSVLRMIEGINLLPEGALGFADARAATDLHEFFTLRLPRDYHTVPAQKDAKFFLSQKGQPEDPDDD
ncbi:MAG: alkaline phosphatase family protein [Terracidiphilus sp.]